MKNTRSKLRNIWIENKTYLYSLSLYTFLFLFFCSKMSPLYPTNEWADVNVYFNVGKGMLSGMTLYSEIFDHKGPLVFIVYGIGSLFSGSSFIGLFILQLIGWVIAVWASYMTARLYLEKITAFIVALLIPLSFLSYMYNGGSAEEMVLLLSTISLYFFVAYFRQEGDKKHKPWYMFIHGVLTAMTFFIKLNLMLFWFFPLLAIFVLLLINREYKNFLQNCLAYLAGFALVAFPILGYFLYNGALGEAYHVYIEMNKLYSSTDDYGYLITNGFNKLYKGYRVHLVWYIIITLGFAYFPFKYIDSKLGKIAFLFSGLAVILLIFFPLTFHFYYPLPLFLYAPLGLICIFRFLEKYVSFNNSKKLIYFAACAILLMGVNKRNFFDLGAETLLRQRDPDGPQFVFRDIVKNEKGATLVNLAFGEGNALFTTADLTPTVKYFFCPNIYYEMYPDLRDAQAKYIEQKETLFVLDCNTGFNYDFFQTFEPLQANYTLIDSLIMNSEYIKGKPKTFYLYKRND